MVISPSSFSNTGTINLNTSSTQSESFNYGGDINVASGATFSGGSYHLQEITLSIMAVLAIQEVPSLIAALIKEPVHFLEHYLPMLQGPCCPWQFSLPKFKFTIQDT